MSVMAAAADSPSSAAAADSFYPHGLQAIAGGSSMRSTISRLGSVELEPTFTASPFVRPQSVIYEFDGRKRRWDMIRTHNSVGIIIYHTGLRAILIVRQFRPAVYANILREERESGRPPPPLAAGFTYELCAGIVDKDKSLQEVAQEEVAEECGYQVPASTLQRVTAYRSSMGTSGSQHTMFLATVDESLRASSGGGLKDAGEAIEVLALPLAGVDGFVADDSCPKSAGLLFALMWLRAQPAPPSAPDSVRAAAAC